MKQKPKNKSYVAAVSSIIRNCVVDRTQLVHFIAPFLSIYNKEQCQETALQQTASVFAFTYLYVMLLSNQVKIFTL